METPYILHMLTPGKQASPFDVNMAADAGWQILVPYCEAGLDQVTALTQDAIFSRGPKGVVRTGLFIGGRDAILAADMLDKAVASMVKPFVISAMADPSGAYTTAAAMVACTEKALRRTRPDGLQGAKVVVLGGLGPVGRIAGAMAAHAGAVVTLSSRAGAESAEKGALETGKRFGCTLHGVSGADRDAVRASIAEVDVILACAAAGVQVVSAEDLRHAQQLKVAADVNAVPPEGIAGVGVYDDAVPVAGSAVLGIGALAVGNVKYQTHRRLLERMRQREEGEKAVTLGYAEAFQMARSVLAEADAK